MLSDDKRETACQRAADIHLIERHAASSSADPVERIGRPILLLTFDATTPAEVLAWLVESRIQALNVTGSRESRHPGIGDRAETALQRLFRLIVEGRRGQE